jgi:multiple sugar transport system ATP-binding protein
MLLTVCERFHIIRLVVLEARVYDIEDQGVIKILTIDLGSAPAHVAGPHPTRLHATVPAGTRVKRDEVVRFGWRPEKLLLFDPATGARLAAG